MLCANTSPYFSYIIQTLSWSHAAHFRVSSAAVRCFFGRFFFSHAKKHLCDCLTDISVTPTVHLSVSLHLPLCRLTKAVFLNLFILFTLRYIALTTFSPSVPLLFLGKKKNPDWVNNTFNHRFLFEGLRNKNRPNG